MDESNSSQHIYIYIYIYILGYHQRCVRISPVMHKLSCYWRLLFHAVGLHVIFDGKWAKHRGSRLESLRCQILRLNIIWAVIKLWTQQNYYIHYHPNLRLVSGSLTHHQPGVGNDHQILEENLHMTRISFHRVQRFIQRILIIVQLHYSTESSCTQTSPVLQSVVQSSRTRTSSPHRIRELVIDMCTYIYAVETNGCWLEYRQWVLK